MFNLELKTEINEQIKKIVVLEKMLNENTIELNKDTKLYAKNFNSTKTSILNQIVILRNELLVLSQKIKKIR